MARSLSTYQIRLIKEPHLQLSTYQEAGLLPPSRKNTPLVPFALPFDWHADPLNDKNWMFQLHAWRMLDAYLNAIHQRDGVEQALDRAIDIIRDWHRDNVAEGPGDWSWYDMSTGIRASKIAFLACEMADLGRDICELDFVEELVTLHFEHLMDPAQLNPGNHGLFQIWGLKSLAVAFPEHNLRARAEDYAIRTMCDLVTRQLGEYGIHTENSPAYHFFAVAQIRNILRAPDWHVLELEFIREKLEASEKAKPWMLDPHGRQICVGDTSPREVDTARLPPLTAWPHQSSGGIMGAILDGYAVVRTTQETRPDQSSLLFLTASFQTKTHKHSDCLSFIWQEKGEDILIDSGKYGYSKGPMRRYMLSTHAHNTVEFNRKTASRKAKDAYGSGIQMLECRADGWFVDAEAPHPTDGYTHRRSVVFRPGREVIVFDHVRPHGLRSKVENEYTLWWHFPSYIRVTQNGAHVFLSGFKALEGINLFHFSNVSQPSIHHMYGETDGRYQGWISTDYLQAEAAPVIGYAGYTTGDFVAATVLQVVATGQPYSRLVKDALLTDTSQLDWAEGPCAALKQIIHAL